MSERQFKIDEIGEFSLAARTRAPWLWALLGLFCLRVLGQLLVATLQVEFLPPMEEWYSGLLPYPPLLASQLVIIVACGSVCVQFSRGSGWFTRPRRRLGKYLLAFGALYLGAMIVRYVVQMSLYPAERWTGGTIPIVLHCVLAGFILIVASFQRRFGSHPKYAPQHAEHGSRDKSA